MAVAELSILKRGAAADVVSEASVVNNPLSLSSIMDVNIRIRYSRLMVRTSVSD